MYANPSGTGQDGGEQGGYQNLLHDDECGSTFPTKVARDHLPRRARMVKPRRLAGGILETSRWEYRVRGVRAALMLTVCAVADCGQYRVGGDFELDCAAETGAVEDHCCC